MMIIFWLFSLFFSACRFSILANPLDARLSGIRRKRKPKEAAAGQQPGSSPDAIKVARHFFFLFSLFNTWSLLCILCSSQSLTLNSPAEKREDKGLSELRYAGPTLSPSPRAQSPALAEALLERQNRFGRLLLLYSPASD